MLKSLIGQESKPASTTWIVAKTLLQTMVFWSLFLGVIPWAIYQTESLLGWEASRFASIPSKMIGVVIFFLGGTLGITSGMMMAIIGKGTPLPTDCAPKLVIRGPYCYVRNPMAIAGLSQAIAVGIFWGSPSIIAYGLVGGPIWHFFVRPAEEADLEERFGDSYRDYQSNVKCWCPRLSGWESNRPQ